MIAKITHNLDKFNYNVIIANMYETYNFLTNYIKTNSNSENLEVSYKKILICFSPIIPHFTNECLLSLSYKNNIEWPAYDKTKLEDDKINIVIQINGKKRSIINTNKGSTEKELLEKVKTDKIIEKYLSKKRIIKTIFVKDKLMNILINE